MIVLCFITLWTSLIIETRGNGILVVLWGNQYFDFTVKGSWKNKSSPFAECKRKYGEKITSVAFCLGVVFIEHAAAEIGLARNCCNCCADGVAQYSSL